jgi:hypothetical protein
VAFHFIDYELSHSEIVVSDVSTIRRQDKVQISQIVLEPAINYLHNIECILIAKELADGPITNIVVGKRILIDTCCVFCGYEDGSCAGPAIDKDCGESEPDSIMVNSNCAGDIVESAPYAVVVVAAPKIAISACLESWIDCTKASCIGSG